nr:MAG TPA: hypothetical protein [Caudoviricetes sp.]
MWVHIFQVFLFSPKSSPPKSIDILKGLYYNITI